jgi:transcriptional regulator with XRE-family HTH domain
LALSIVGILGYPKIKTGLYVLQKLFGGRLRQLREERGLSQQDLANSVGVESDGTIRRWETGKRWPGPDTIEKLAKALGVRARDLFTFPDDPDL